MQVSYNNYNKPSDEDLYKVISEMMIKNPEFGTKRIRKEAENLFNGYVEERRVRHMLRKLNISLNNQIIIEEKRLVSTPPREVLKTLQKERNRVIETSPSKKQISASKSTILNYQDEEPTQFAMPAKKNMVFKNPLLNRVRKMTLESQANNNVSTVSSLGGEEAQDDQENEISLNYSAMTTDTTINHDNNNKIVTGSFEVKLDNLNNTNNNDDLTPISLKEELEEKVIPSSALQIEHNKNNIRMEEMIVERNCFDFMFSCCTIS